MARTTRIEVEITGDARRLQKEFNKAAKSATVFNTKITRSFSGISRGLGFGAATAGLAGFTLALRGTIQAGIDFESSFAGVRKTVDATEPQFRQLAKGFRDLAREIPVTVDELNRIGESAGQLGIRRDAILDFTKTVAALGATTNLASDQAADALARIANITGLPQDEFDRLGSTIVDLGNKLAATESEIVDFALRISGAGRQANLTEAAILGISGAFASVGVESERGGTAVSKVLLAMNSAVISGGKELESFAKVTGDSAAAFRERFQRDSGQAFLAFVQGLERIRVAGGDTQKVLKDLGLSDARLIASFQAMAAGHKVLAQALSVGDAAWESNNALTKEAEKRYNTTAARLQVFQNRVRDLQITLADTLIPVLEDVVNPLSDWLESTENQRKVQQELTAVLDDAAAAIKGVRDVTVPLAETLREAAGHVGGLRQAVRLLVAAFVAAKIVSFTGALTGLSTQALATTGRVNALRFALLRLSAIGVIAIGIEVAIRGEEIHKTVESFLDDKGLGFLTGNKIEIPLDIDSTRLKELRDEVARVKGESSGWVKVLDKLLVKLRQVEVARSKRPDDQGGLQGVGAVESDNRQRAAAEKKAAEERARAIREAQARINALSKLEEDAAGDVSKKREKAAEAARKAADRAREAARRAREAFDELLDSFDLQVDRALANKNFRSALKFLQEEQRAVLDRIKIEGRTAELERKLFDIQQQRRDIRRQQSEDRAREREEKQFRALGLSSTGDEKLPGLKALRKQFQSIGQAIEGTFLDTGKTASLMDRIRKVLSGKLGKISEDVRRKIKELLDDLGQQLKDADPESGTGHITRRRITANNQVSAFGFNLSPTAQKPIHIHLEMDGKEVSNVVIGEAQRRNRRHVGSRGGRHGGTKLF